MKTYIVNLERSKERKSYMENILRDIPWVDLEFIPAVDGKSMTTTEQSTYFDIKKFKQRYSVSVRPGEIGCTLSHQKCYRKIVEDNEPYALILEDDILKPTNDLRAVINRIAEMMVTEKPRVILLSGWYWFKNKHDFIGGYKLTDVFDAFLTHAYVINRAAAKLLVEDRPFITADDWRYIRQKGVHLQAICPHLIDQNWDGNLVTTVNVEIAKRKSFNWYYHNIGRLAYMKFLKWIGHFEKA